MMMMMLCLLKLSMGVRLALRSRNADVRDYSGGVC